MVDNMMICCLRGIGLPSEKKLLHLYDIDGPSINDLTIANCQITRRYALLCVYIYILIMFHFIGLLRYLLVVEVQYEARKLCCFTTGNGHLTSKHCICSTDLNGYFQVISPANGWLNPPAPSAALFRSSSSMYPRLGLRGNIQSKTIFLANTSTNIRGSFIDIYIQYYPTRCVIMGT